MVLDGSVFFIHMNNQGYSKRFGWYGHGRTTFLGVVGNSVAGEAMAVLFFTPVTTFHLWIAHCMHVAVNIEHELASCDASMTICYNSALNWSRCA